MDVLTPEHARWNEFRKLLEGPDGLDFREDEKGVYWTGGNSRLSVCQRVLESMKDVDVIGTLLYLARNGGGDDIEVVFNLLERDTVLNVNEIESTYELDPDSVYVSVTKAILEKYSVGPSKPLPKFVRYEILPANYPGNVFVKAIGSDGAQGGRECFLTIEVSEKETQVEGYDAVVANKFYAYLNCGVEPTWED